MIHVTLDQFLTRKYYSHSLTGKHWCLWPHAREYRGGSLAKTNVSLVIDFLKLCFSSALQGISIKRSWFIHFWEAFISFWKQANPNIDVSGESACVLQLIQYLLSVISNSPASTSCPVWRDGAGGGLWLAILQMLISLDLNVHQNKSCSSGTVCESTLNIKNFLRYKSLSNDSTRLTSERAEREKEACEQLFSENINKSPVSVREIESLASKSVQV